MYTQYLVVDDTLKKVISTRPEVISAVEDAESYHETSKNKIVIYSAQVCGILEQEELLI